MTLSNLSNLDGVCIHVSVTDVIHKTLPAFNAASAYAAVAGLALAEQ